MRAGSVQSLARHAAGVWNGASSLLLPWAAQERSATSPRSRLTARYIAPRESPGSSVDAPFLAVFREEKATPRRPTLATVTDQLATVVAWLRDARRVLVFTGAGISTESGIPDFRGPNGLWTKVDPSRFTLQNFVADSEVRRESWQNRLHSTLEEARPNAGHRAVAELGQLGKVGTVVTQNIDGLHQLAGSRDVIELHGTTREAACLSCRRRLPIASVLDRVREGDVDPHCEICGGLLKTATISFGQALIEADLIRAHAEASACDLCLAAGSTLSVWPAAGVPLEARRSGARLVIVNDGDTELDEAASTVIRGRTGEVLPALVAGLSGAQV
ncbi:MAG: NAD-dependent deacylase [Chloroflexi bacterium]|nr:MAG: NAD-dependent deacylase [Chloroflexota bacterium]